MLDSRLCRVIVCVAMLLPGLAAADLTVAPAKGMLLVATEQVFNGLFQRSVVLLISYDQNGAAGLIVNRPTEMPLSKILPEYQAADADRMVYRGGPVQPLNMFVLTRTKRTHPSMSPILEDIYLAVGVQAFAHIADQLGANEKLRAYAGFSGWGPGQLEAEIVRGDWLVVPGSTGHVFSESPEALWAQLLKSWSGNWI